MASPTTNKPEFVSDFAEFDSIDEENAAKSASLIAKLDKVRLGLTVLATLSAITVLGTAGDALSNYNKTTLGRDYIISIWPNEFDIRPTTALVVCSAVVLLTSLLSLAGFKVAAVSSIRKFDFSSNLARRTSLIFYRFAMLPCSMPSSQSVFPRSV